MAEVILTAKAKQQIHEIAEYIERDSPLYAKRVIQKIIATVSRLKSFP